MERIILHCDINNCFAAIECAENPELRGKPVAVCGDEQERHGIVLAKSNEAKVFGIQTGVTVWSAKLRCPGLIVIKPHYKLYMKYSQAARSIYCRYTNQVEPFGIDECWLDVTGSTKLFGSGFNIADTIRKSILDELGITISAGVSFNKIFAKLASDMKKPNAVTCVYKNEFKEKIWPLPVSALIGVGHRTARKLDSLYIKTIGDLANERPERLSGHLGKCGIQLWNYANGLDTSPVADCDYSPPVKSIGHGITTPSDIKTNEEVWSVIFALTESIGKKLRANRLSARGIQVSVKDSEFRTYEFQCALSAPTQSTLAISRSAFSLFSKKYAWTHDIRSVSVRAISLVPPDYPYQIDIFGEALRISKIEKLEDIVYKLQERFGNSAANYATLLNAGSRHGGSDCGSSFRRT